MGPTGGQLRTAEDGRPDPQLAWLLCIASRLSNSVLSSIMRPYNPHTARQGHRHPAVRSRIQERSLGQMLRPRPYQNIHTSA